jgi:hypothetical protein
MFHMFIHYTEDIDKFDTWSIFLAGYSLSCTYITLTEDFSSFYLTGNLRNVISNNYSIWDLSFS